MASTLHKMIAHAARGRGGGGYRCVVQNPSGAGEWAEDRPLLLAREAPGASRRGAQSPTSDMADAFSGAGSEMELDLGLPLPQAANGIPRRLLLPSTAPSQDRMGCPWLPGSRQPRAGRHWDHGWSQLPTPQLVGIFISLP